MTASPPLPPCLILGNGITALGVIRSLGRAGITSFSVSPNMGESKHSRWYRRISYDTPLLTPGTSLEEYLRALHLPSAILIPCSDTFATEVAALPANLAARFPSVHSTEDALNTCIDKGAFAALLERLQIPHPKSYVIENSRSFDSVPDEFFSSSFLKPRDSQRFFKAYGIKAQKVFSRKEALSRFEEYASDGMSMLFQEYIPGPPTNHYFIDGYVSTTGELVAIFARQRIRMYPSDFGNSSYMTSVSLSSAEEPIASLHKIFDAVSYRGIFSAEFKKDARDGTFRLLEINARPWWFIEFASRCGINVCNLLYREATAQPLPTLPPYKVGASCVNLYYDWHAAQLLVHAEQISWAAVIFSWLRAKKVLFCWDDPLPSLVWLGSSVTRKLSRCLRPQRPMMQPHQA